MCLGFRVSGFGAQVSGLECGKHRDQTWGLGCRGLCGFSAHAFDARFSVHVGLRG